MLTSNRADDVLDAHLFFTLTMLLKEHFVEKVEAVEYGEGLRLWRLLVTDFEAQFASRKLVLQQDILSSRAVQVRIRGKESIVWKRRSAVPVNHQEAH